MEVGRRTLTPLTFAAVDEARASSAKALREQPVGVTRETVQRYRMTLVRQEEGGFAEAVAALAGLVLSTDGYVHCYADATRLSPGSYVLRLQSDSRSPGLAEEFPFNLRARNAVPSR